MKCPSSPSSTTSDRSSAHSPRDGAERISRHRPPGFGLYRQCDRLSGALIIATIIWGPWSFGCTTPWAILTQNCLGYSLGVLVVAKVLLRRFSPALLGDRPPGRYWVDTALALVSGLLLAYVLISAVNARITIHPGTYQLTYHHAVMWLPHSYDSVSSWRAFALYLGLAGFFWGVRDWLRYPAPGDNHSTNCPSHLPRRVRVLLWVACLNGTLLAIQGLAQRVSGSNQLLWLVTPRINRTAVSQFGPYAYRANAAQYFNLLWPVALGFWWTYRRGSARPMPEDGDDAYATGAAPASASRARQSGHLLLSCVVLMAVCPIVSTSRGGALIMGGMAVLALALLGSALWRSSWGAKLAVLSLLVGVVSLGLLLGWEDLGPRMEMLQQGYEQREAMFATGRRMAEESPVFGTGPGTFRHAFGFYRRSADDYWPAQMHNDWLETRITFGWVGSALLLTALALALGRWFLRGGLAGEKTFVALTWCALGGCLLHSRFDFPFQIPSIVALFLLLCAILSCLSRQRPRHSHRLR